MCTEQSSSSSSDRPQTKSFHCRRITRVASSSHFHSASRAIEDEDLCHILISDFSLRSKTKSRSHGWGAAAAAASSRPWLLFSGSLDIHKDCVRLVHTCNFLKHVYLHMVHSQHTTSFFFNTCCLPVRHTFLSYNMLKTYEGGIRT